MKKSNTNTETQSSKLTDEDLAVSKSIAETFVQGGRTMKEGYMQFLGLLQYDEEMLLADNAKYFQPERFRYDLVMKQYQVDFYEALVKDFLSEGHVEPEAKKKAMTRVNNTKSAMIKWFKENLPVDFYKPSETPEGTKIDKSGWTAQQLFDDKIKEAREEQTDQVSDVISDIREIAKQWKANTEATARGNKELVYKPANTFMTSLFAKVEKHKETLNKAIKKNG